MGSTQYSNYLVIPPILEMVKSWPREVSDLLKVT